MMAEVAASNWLEKTPQERHRAMMWMQRLKRVFGIDIETCERCGVKVKVIVSFAVQAKTDENQPEFPPE